MLPATGQLYFLGLWLKSIAPVYLSTTAEGQDTVFRNIPIARKKRVSETISPLNVPTAAAGFDAAFSQAESEQVSFRSCIMPDRVQNRAA